MQVKDRLIKLGINLPNAAVPVANYVPYTISGKQIMISGQVPIVNGSVEGNTGKIGLDLTIEQGKKIARICGINLVAQVNNAVNGKLDTVRCLKLGVFINAVDNFDAHPEVANGASDLMVEVFGDNGKHARSSVGVASLPRGVAVEIDAVFEII